MWSVVPKLEILTKVEIKSELLACRSCLGVGRLYNMQEGGLAESYKQLVGVEVRETHILPQHLCHLCRFLVLKFIQFRERCRRAEILLQNLTNLAPVITLDDVAAIDRAAENISLPYSYTTTSIVTCLEEDIQEVLEEKPQEEYPVEFKQDDLSDTEVKCDLDFIETDVVDEITEIPVKRTRKRKQKEVVIDAEEAEVIKEDVEVQEEKVKKTRKNAKPRVNNLYTDPEDRLKFSQKYDVDIIVMSKEDEVNDMLQRKNSAKYLRAHNKCEQCYKGFIHEDTLKRHIKDKHDPSMEHACEFCRFRFSKRVNLTGHYRRLHKYKYVCRVCSVVTRMREHAVQHSKMHTQKFECKYCDKTFNSKGTTYHAHVRSQHGTQLPWCRICGDAFVCIKTHRKRLHKETLTPAPELQCVRCSTQFLSTEALAAHSAADAQCSVKQWCVHCGRGFDAETELREHVLALHKVQFPCEKCNKVFSLESRLNNHMLERHSEDLPPGDGAGAGAGEGQRGGRKRYMKVVPAAMCDVCGKIITNQYHMVYHQRIHTGEKPYSCTECPKRFRLPELLQNHVRIHTGERPFKCKYCPNTFKTYPAMSRHHLVHTGVRRYPCSVCGKPFATSAEMKTHVRTVHMKLPPPPRTRRRPRAPPP